MSNWRGFRTVKQKQIERQVAAYARLQMFSGAVLVAQNGRVVHRSICGLASHELQVKLGFEHRFNIGSISKLFVALAVARLAEQGRLDLNDPLSMTLLDFPNADLITLTHLLTNTAGLADHIVDPVTAELSTKAHSLDQLVALIGGMTPIAAPGTGLAYSNAHWVLLAKVIERVTGRPYAVAMKELVFDKAGLKNTGIAISAGVIPNQVSGYEIGISGVSRANFIDPSFEIGAGGVYSSCDDLWMLRQALSAGIIVSAEMWAQMQEPRERADDLGYGLGVISGRRFGREWHGHSGGTMGFVGTFTHYNSDDLTIIVLCNYGNGDAIQLDKDIAAIMFDEAYNAPRLVTGIGLTFDQLSKFTGSYAMRYMGRPIVLNVISVGNGLEAKFPMLPVAALLPISPTSFQAFIKGGRVTFVFDQNGVALNWSGEKIYGVRR